ncbi:MAG: carboxypeptidase-like regulatory domain-containing protein [Thermoleophilia bacterium]
MRRYRLVTLLAVGFALLWTASPAAAGIDTSVNTSASPARQSIDRSAFVGRTSHTPNSLHNNQLGPGALSRPASVVVRDVIGTCAVSGVVRDFAGLPVAGVDVELGHYDASRYTSDLLTTTAGDGSFLFSDAPITSDGALWTWRSGTNYGLYNLTFAAGSNYYVLRPGQVTIQASRSTDSSWNQWDSMWVACYGGGGSAGTAISGASGQAHAMPPSLDYVATYFWSNEGTEDQYFANPIACAAGATSASAVHPDESKAKRVWLSSPYWASGPPGATIKLLLSNWPAGQKAQFWGEMDTPQVPWADYTGEWTSKGQDATVSMKVPKWATPGYTFLPHVWRSDDLWEFNDFVLNEFYQVCTLKPSKSTISRGSTITLSGVVPTEGHWGKQAGRSKTVTLYVHAGSAKVPTKWNPTTLGWAKVASFKADGLGRFKSPKLKVRATCTFVLRYPGDKWYWGAYTGTTKVKVR